MIKRSTFFLLIMVSIGCRLYAQTPVAFNADLSSRADSFFRLGAIWGSKLEDISHASRNYEELKPYRLRATDYIDLQVNELTLLKDVKDSKNMRLALIEFLKFEKTLINSSFMQIEKLPAKATEQQMQLAFGSLEEASAKEEPYLMKLIQAQEAYAANNGFKVADEKAKR